MAAMSNITTGHINSSFAGNLSTAVFAGPLTFLAPWLVCLIILCWSSAFLLAMLILTLILERKWRSPSTFLIIHHLLLDFNACFLSFPLLALDQFLHLFGDSLKVPCAFYFTVMALWFVHLWMGTNLAANRFVAVLLPNYYKIVTSRLVISCTLSASWMIGIASITPVFFNVGCSFMTNEIGDCGFVIYYDLAWYIILGCGLLLPNFIQGLIYAAIFVSLFRKRPGRKLAGVASATQLQRTQRNVKVVKMLAVSYLVSLACYTVAPLMMGFVTVGFDGSGEIGSVGKLLEALGYATAPVIYLAMNDDYRRATKRLVCKCIPYHILWSRSPKEATAAANREPAVTQET